MRNLGKKVYDSLNVLPDSVKVQCSVQPEVRARSIYEIMLYKADIKIQAYVSLPESRIPGGWKSTGDNARFLIRITDVKGITGLHVKLNDKEVPVIAGGVIAVPVKKEMLFANGGKLSFALDLQLNGCRSLFFAPIGKNFALSMTSPWAHPSFIGGFLPHTREITEKGFTADWSVSELNSSFSQTWTGASDIGFGSDRCVGISLVQPAGTYMQVERVSNYAFLVIAIVLIAFLIGERVTKIKVHPLQYFFTGLSLIMFYVLLLALAEHIPFNLSYVISGLVIVGMTVMYCRMIFSERKSAAFVLGCIMALAYALIFVLTRLEDYALLAGSGILLVLLGIMMRVTGNMAKDDEIESVK